MPIPDGHAAITPKSCACPLDRASFYRDLRLELDAVLAGETDPTANAANTAAVLFHGLARVNWAGFYFLQGSELVLGPFQGRPACVRIPIGKGVCGRAAVEQRSVLVRDVHDFPGHIACDPISRSELVIPLLDGSRLLGVLDLDSPDIGRFDLTDQTECESIAADIVRYLSPFMLS